MEAKYYTPEIDELYSGYEGEYLGDYGEWKQIDLSIQDIMDYSENGFDLRTKYLDKEDIESLGWIHRVHSLKNSFGNNYYSYNFIVPREDSKQETFILNPGKDHNYYIGQKIINTNPGLWEMGLMTSPRFNGKIKSINELRKIMKFLEINIH